MGRWRRLSTLSSGDASSTPGASRRETFAFDQVLYSDERIAVTPSVLVVVDSRRRWPLRESEYNIQDVGQVRMPQLASARTWWRPRRTLHNLRVEVHSDGCVPAVSVVQVHAENPGAALLAIEKAKGIVY